MLEQPHENFQKTVDSETEIQERENAGGLWGWALRSPTDTVSFSLTAISSKCIPCHHSGVSGEETKAPGMTVFQGHSASKENSVHCQR